MITGRGPVDGLSRAARPTRHSRTNRPGAGCVLTVSRVGWSRRAGRQVEETRYAAARTDAGTRTTTGRPGLRAARGQDMSLLKPSRRTLAGLAAGCWAVLSSAAALAQPPASDDDKLPVVPPADVTPAGPTLNLGECIAIAQERQPTIRGALHSQAASQRGYDALMNLPRVAEWVSPDVPVRREQARRGLTLAAAAVEQARRETTYDVIYLYYSFVYARQQEQTALNVIAELRIYLQVMREVLKQGVSKKVDQYSVYNLETKIGEVEQLQTKATIGRQRALEALKEAMGVDPCFEFTPRDPELPIMGGQVTKEQVIALATANRSELVQAAAGTDAFRLEVAAQAKLRTFGQTNTLASGADLHAKAIPFPLRNGEYKPAPPPPEMPPHLVGRREDRVARACELSLKQEASYDKIVGLIRLESANAYLEWEQATSRMTAAKLRYEAARKIADDTREVALTKQEPQLVVQYEAEAGRAQADYVEAVFEHLKALAKLERVTAGAVRPAFPGR